MNERSHFIPGDRVRFRQGAFSGFDAIVVDVDETTQTLHVAIPVFGREHSLELQLIEASRVLEAAD